MARGAGARRDGRRRHGELETEVLGALWAVEESLTPGQVQQALGGQLAHNTVHTVLARLHDKGLVTRCPAGRTHTYRPTRGAETVAAQQMAALLARGPDHEAVLQRFVSSLSSEDESALRRLLTAEPTQR